MRCCAHGGSAVPGQTLHRPPSRRRAVWSRPEERKACAVARSRRAKSAGCRARQGGIEGGQEGTRRARLRMRCTVGPLGPPRRAIRLPSRQLLASELTNVTVPALRFTAYGKPRRAASAGRLAAPAAPRRCCDVAARRRSRRRRGQVRYGAAVDLPCGAEQAAHRHRTTVMQRHLDQRLVEERVLRVFRRGTRSAPDRRPSVRCSCAI